MNSLSFKIKYPNSDSLRKVILGGSSAKFCFVVGALFFMGGSLSSQAIELVSNGDFKIRALLFSAYPGDVETGGNPTDIPNWKTYPNQTGKGLNGAVTRVGNVFGPVDDGGYTYAFVHGTGHGIYQYIPMQPNTTYTVEVDVAGRSTNPRAAFSIQFAKPSWEAIPFWDSRDMTSGKPNVASLNSFTHYSVEVTTPSDLAGVATIQLWNRSPVGDFTVVFANVSVSTKVEGEVFDSVVLVDVPKVQDVMPSDPPVENVAISSVVPEVSDIGDAVQEETVVAEPTFSDKIKSACWQ